MSTYKANPPNKHQESVTTNLHLRMKRRQWYGIWGFFLLLVGTLAFGFYSQIEDNNLSLYEKSLELAIHKAENNFEQYFLNDILLQRILDIYDQDSAQNKSSNLEEVIELMQQPFSILIYEDQRLVFWSNNQVLLEPSQLERIKEQNQNGLIQLDNGFYEANHRLLLGPKGEYYVIGLLPIKRDFQVNSDYLQNQFVLDLKNFPENLELSLEPTAQ